MNKNVAVVGVGAWGKNLVRVFEELGVLHSTYDISDSSEIHLRLIPDVL